MLHRQLAESWLSIKFKDEQPPCLPTDLQCEFICESIKNADNSMTKVFICHSDKDQEIRDKIFISLARQGLTVWNSGKDMRTGTEFQQEIKEGIEGSDNFIYISSLNSLESKYCQQELAYALSNNKKIVCILTDSKSSRYILKELRSVKLIDFTDYQITEEYSRSFDKLLNFIEHDKGYYYQHKLLLVKALKWKRQNYNKSILLRGYALQNAQIWLQMAQQRSKDKPLPLQLEFIQASSNQPTDLSAEVFISYTSENADFANKLNEAFQELGKTTWFDQENIPLDIDCQQEIYRGIENSNNFLLIVSPSSVNSYTFIQELEYAQKFNKRLVPIIYGQVSEQDLPSALADLEGLNFNQYGSDFTAHFKEIIRIIDTDREHVQSHTKYSQQALEWQKKNKSTDLLLRGGEFAIAQNRQ